MDLILELHYLPTIPYFALLQKADTIWLNLQENYPKQTLRNRTFILTANGVQALSIPILKNSSKATTQEVQIDYTQRWFHVHWRAIQSSYGKSPFFEYFADYFEGFYQKKYTALSELNLQILTTCLQLLQWQKNIKIIDKNTDISLFSKADNQCNQIEIANLSVIAPNYEPKPYKQVFGKSFVPNLSIIDLLFCQGLDIKPYLS